jgi:putative oxidoreductase
MTRFPSTEGITSKTNPLERFLAPRRELAYALLRIVSGLMFSFHGAQKLFGVLTDHQPALGSQVWFGGVIELGCGLAVALGMFTSPAAFLASGTMAVAYTQFHWKLALGASFFPVVNEGELALLYCLVFLYMACVGSGPYGFDHRSRR